VRIGGSWEFAESMCCVCKKLQGDFSFSPQIFFERTIDLEARLN
jgi:hypothetical protein